MSYGLQLLACTSATPAAIYNLRKYSEYTQKIWPQPITAGHKVRLNEVLTDIISIYVCPNTYMSETDMSHGHSYATARREEPVMLGLTIRQLHQYCR